MMPKCPAKILLRSVSKQIECHEMTRQLKYAQNIDKFKFKVHIWRVSSHFQYYNYISLIALLLAASHLASPALIHIHKTANELTNSGNEDPALKAAGLEFRSPMKRIVDLISHHTPIIVIASTSDTQSPVLNPQAAQSKREQQTLTSSQQQSQSQSQQQPTSMASNSISIGGHQWAFVDPSGQVQSPHLLTAQQQQLVPTSALPMEQQYFLPVQSHFGPLEEANSQVAILPGAFNYASMAPGSFQSTTSQQTESSYFPNQLQQATNSEDRAQPVFLSSYVPELQSGQMAPTFGKTQMNNQEVRPDSIQQVQQSQTQNTSKIQAKPDEDKARETSNDELGDNSANQNIHNQVNDDIEEPTSTKKSLESDDPSQNSSGSISYEDKYDSDKDNKSPDESQGASGSNNQARTSAGLDGAMTNGLVSVGLNDDCLQCICRASSGCDEQLRCITRGSEDKYCGPFQLTEEYWNKAGSPGDPANSGFTSFEDCANDVECAVETVTNYMKRYHKDCDGDDNITCMDYARLHRLRPDECDNTEKLANDFDAYWAKFQRCAETYNRTRTGEDEDI